MKSILLCFSLFSASVFAGVCEVPKEKMQVAEIALGKPVVELMRYHKGVSLQREWEKGDDRQLQISNQAESEWVMDSPVSDINYISYSERDYKVNSFAVRLNFSNIDTEKVKEASIILFNLPKNGWKKKTGDDPKYGEIISYTYSCDGYKIYLSDSANGVSLIFNPIEDKAP